MRNSSCWLIESLTCFFFMKKDMKFRCQIPKQTITYIHHARCSGHEGMWRRCLDLDEGVWEIHVRLQFWEKECQAVVVQWSRAITGLRIEGRKTYPGTLNFSELINFHAIHSLLLDTKHVCSSVHCLVRLFQNWVTFGADTKFERRLTWLTCSQDLAPREHV